MGVRASNCLCAAIVAVTAIAGALGAEPAAAEYQVKAEFLERFTRFVDWPPATNAPHFTIGVLGNSPFNGYLDRIAAEHRIKGRPVEVRYLESAEQVEACHLLFIAGSERERLRGILARTEAKPILTVSDSDGFAAAGVVINLYREGETVRFEINPAAAEKSGLKISSYLLKLARIVRPEAVR